VKNRSLSEAPQPFLYLPLLQDYRSNMILVARTATEPEKMFQSVHDEVAALDPEIPMFDVKTLEEHVGISLFLEHMAATLLSIFGLLALSLAAIGLYGVMAYSVSRRTRELGIRISVGAERHDIFKLILGQGLALSVVGLLAGLIASLAATRLTGNLLYGVSATDPVTFIVIALLLMCVTLLLLPGAPGDQDRPDDCVASRITHSAGFETIPYRSNSAQFGVPFHASFSRFCLARMCHRTAPDSMDTNSAL
jgi:hypothetical protein